MTDPLPPVLIELPASEGVSAFAEVYPTGCILGIDDTEVYLTTGQLEELLAATYACHDAQASAAATAITCPWCHAIQIGHSGPAWCRREHCGHRIDLPRMTCDCVKCQPLVGPRPPASAEDVAAAKALLSRRGK